MQRMSVAERISWFTVEDGKFAIYRRETYTQQVKHVETILYPQEMEDEYNKRTNNNKLELADRNMQREKPRVIAIKDIVND